MATSKSLLQVENILVDERNRAAPPIYVLCDFGSATTRVLSTADMRQAEVEEEVSVGYGRSRARVR